MRLVWFTANEAGGILQFAAKLHETALDLGFESFLCAPKGAKLKCPNLVTFELVGHIATAAEIHTLERMLLNLKPTVILAVDDPFTTLRVFSCLSKKLRCVQFIHDVNPHSSQKGLKLTVRRVIVQLYRNRVLKRADKVALMSRNSSIDFEKRYRKYAGKVVVLPLGAHLLTEEQVKPCEMGSMRDYLLFFGRIEKYKGVGRLLKAWNSCDHGDLNLVIAGGGSFTDEEAFLIDEASDVVVLNRFIEDEEMNYLIANALAVVLPYIDATQSGVIPIAYHFGTGVIASNLPGLSEFVVGGVTGLTFKDDCELSRIIADLTENPSKLMKMGACARDYEQERFNWKRNLGEFIGAIEANCA